MAQTTATRADATLPTATLAAGRPPTATLSPYTLRCALDEQ